MFFLLSVFPKLAKLAGMLLGRLSSAFSCSFSRSFFRNLGDLFYFGPN